jgi:hypothetical protein
MNRAITQGLTLLVWAVLSGAACAEPLPAAAGESQDVALPSSPANDSASASPSDAFRRMPPPEAGQLAIPCDRREGAARDACRAKLAAKYAEMDKLCRIVSSAEFPVCIKSAYAAD